VARDRGQRILVVALSVVVAGLLAVGVGRLGEAMLHRTQARTAADAAALAGVIGGRADAQRLASANGAVLETFDRSGPPDRVVVTVVVRVGEVRARARATNGP
jgi:Flp pilus assembly protein TadG